MMPHMQGAGWNCTVLAAAGEVDVEQLDDAGLEWLALGPGGEFTGPLAQALKEAISGDAEPGWVEAVVDAVAREIGVGNRRSQLLVKRGTGVWFHVTFSANRESIRRHGLDWNYMSGYGIAGSTAPEWPGIFLCDSLEDAHFFVVIGSRRGPVDTWEVELEGQWLEGAPNSDGGGGDNWMVCPEPIPRKCIRLCETDLTGT